MRLAVCVGELDLLDGLRESPDARPASRVKVWSTGRCQDVGREAVPEEVDDVAEIRHERAVAVLADEKCEGDLMVVAEVVVDVVDAGDAEERLAGEDLDDVELGPRQERRAAVASTR